MVEGEMPPSAGRSRQKRHARQVVSAVEHAHDKPKPMAALQLGASVNFDRAPAMAIGNPACRTWGSGGWLGLTYIRNGYIIGAWRRRTRRRFR